MSGLSEEGKTLLAIGAQLRIFIRKIWIPMDPIIQSGFVPSHLGFAALLNQLRTAIPNYFPIIEWRNVSKLVLAFLGRTLRVPIPE